MSATFGADQLKTDRDVHKQPIQFSPCVLDRAATVRDARNPVEFLTSNFSPLIALPHTVARTYSYFKGRLSTKKN